MKFGKAILSPSHFRKPDFNSIDSLEQSFEFRCVNCSSNIERKFTSIFGKEFGWHDDFDEETQSEIERYFEMNVVGKTPDGGWTAVDQCQCNKCPTQYLIYSGVNEYSNSAYQITLQGISENNR